MSIFPGFNVTDQRDMIYALIPLAKDTHDSEDWIPNYSKTSQDVWESFTTYVIRTTGSLNLLCRPWAPLSPQDVCPSWIPRLSPQVTFQGAMIRTPRTNANLLVGHPGEEKYNASGSSMAEVRRYNYVLWAKGFLVDVIREVGSTPTENNIPQDWRAITMRAANLTPSAQATEIDSDNYLFPEEVCHTLVAGRTTTGDPPGPSYGRACDLIWSSNLNVSMAMESALLSVGDRINLTAFITRVRDCTRHRRLASTNRGRLGLVRSKVRLGDLIVVLLGCSVPVVLRKSGQQYVLFGETYIHGIMNGEAMRDLDLGLYSMQEFAIK
jgi:hypothetical protein